MLDHHRQRQFDITDIRQNRLGGGKDFLFELIIAGFQALQAEKQAGQPDRRQGNQQDHKKHPLPLLIRGGGGIVRYQPEEIYTAGMGGIQGPQCQSLRQDKTAVRLNVGGCNQIREGIDGNHLARQFLCYFFPEVRSFRQRTG
ncbi:MAG: hypothetical protein BWY71_01817 [Planctomycetes bacterium ADurb.Bin412]|nr:MAG: hypothetical protein BWY71_01817 [Planctomycetes bacterium ADurb.Bin412]